MVPSELGLLAQAPMRAASHPARDMQPAHCASRSTGGAASASGVASTLAAGATPRSEQPAAISAAMAIIEGRMSDLLRRRGEPGGGALAALLAGHRQPIELGEVGEVGIPLLVGRVVRVEVAAPHAPQL